MAFCFSAFPLLFAFLTSGGARETRKPLWSSSPAPLRQPPAGLRPRACLGKARSATPAGRPTRALRGAGGGKVAPSPPPRLPVAPGAFLRAEPSRAAERRSRRCRSRETGSEVLPEPRVPFPRESSGFPSPPKGGWLAGCQAVGRGQGRSGGQAATAKAVSV